MWCHLCKDQYMVKIYNKKPTCSTCMKDCLGINVDHENLKMGRRMLRKAKRNSDRWILKEEEKVGRRENEEKEFQLNYVINPDKIDSLKELFNSHTNDKNKYFILQRDDKLVVLRVITYGYDNMRTIEMMFLKWMKEEKSK